VEDRRAVAVGAGLEPVVEINGRGLRAGPPEEGNAALALASRYRFDRRLDAACLEPRSRDGVVHRRRETRRVPQHLAVLFELSARRAGRTRA
jgi:hypothetical protein